MTEPATLARRLDELVRLDRAAGEIADAIRALMLLERIAAAAPDPDALAALEGVIYLRASELLIGLSPRFQEWAERDEVLQ